MSQPRKVIPYEETQEASSLAASSSGELAPLATAGLLAQLKGMVLGNSELVEIVGNRRAIVDRKTTLTRIVEE